MGMEYRSPQDKSLNEKNLKKDQKSQLTLIYRRQCPNHGRQSKPTGKNLPLRKQIWKVINHHPSLSGLSIFLR